MFLFTYDYISHMLCRRTIKVFSTWSGSYKMPPRTLHPAALILTGYSLSLLHTRCPGHLPFIVPGNSVLLLVSFRITEFLDYSFLDYVAFWWSILPNSSLRKESKEIIFWGKLNVWNYVLSHLINSFARYWILNWKSFSLWNSQVLVHGLLFPVVLLRSLIILGS